MTKILLMLENNYLKCIIVIVRLREICRYSLKILSVVRYIDILKKNKLILAKNSRNSNKLDITFLVI